MCYEEGFFRRRAAKKTQKLEETQRVIERAPTTPQPVRPAPATQTKRPKEVETELETV
jgi:hypothetical protein